MPQETPAARAARLAAESKTVATHQIKLRGFRIPNFVLVDDPQPGPDNKFALAELDAETLGQLCDAFRAEVFAKAGKQDPTI